MRLAEEGADIIAVDICRQIDGLQYELAKPKDLADTVEMVEALDRRIVAREADVRDLAALEQVVADGVAELGSLDIVVANAGIGSFGYTADLDEQSWRDVIDVDLTGVWLTCKAAIAHISDGGSMILTSSTMGVSASPSAAHYVAAKHGVIGVMRPSRMSSRRAPFASTACCRRRWQPISS